MEQGRFYEGRYLGQQFPGCLPIVNGPDFAGLIRENDVPEMMPDIPFVYNPDINFWRDKRESE